jgi:hypothetical protein
MATFEVHYEQAVYGSFAFWDRGYAMLAQSPGCRDAWLASFRAACQHYGEPPSGVLSAGGLFTLRLDRGPWMIVGVGPPGIDDRGRPGALAFHAIFVSARDYRRLGGSPFAIAGLLRNDWTADIHSLPAGVWRVDRPAPALFGEDRRVRRIASALANGRRVALEADRPIDVLAESVWQSLPQAVRHRASVATWAYSNDNRFDLVALPRLAGIMLDASYVDPAAIDAAPRMPAPTIARSRWWGGPRIRLLPVLGIVAAVVGALAGVALNPGGRPSAPMREPATPPRATASARRTAPPDASSYDQALPSAEERREVVAGLVVLGERFGIAISGDGDSEPSALMIAIAERLRYRGPWLSAEEVRRLTNDADSSSAHDRALALRWHACVRRFADDRALPERFTHGPLRWQLDVLAWSFHDDSDLSGHHLTTAEIPHALAESLTVDVPLRPTPLTARYPALASYIAFLGRLPRR